MKTHIKRVDYFNNSDFKGKWWSWVETCDNCGEIIQANNVLSSKRPTTLENDYCVKCLRKFIDERNNKE